MAEVICHCRIFCHSFQRIKTIHPPFILILQSYLNSCAAMQQYCWCKSELICAGESGMGKGIGFDVHRCHQNPPPPTPYLPTPAPFPPCSFLPPALFNPFPCPPPPNSAPFAKFTCSSRLPSLHRCMGLHSPCLLEAACPLRCYKALMVVL